MSVAIVQRKPSIGEFESLVRAVGFRGHDDAAVEVALANSLFCVCAEAGNAVVGFGRIVGDGAITLLLTNVMVHPTYQRRGIGTLIVRSLCDCVERLPHRNIVLEALPEPGLTRFYERIGFRASRNAVPGMTRWFNDERAANS